MMMMMTTMMMMMMKTKMRICRLDSSLSEYVIDTGSCKPGNKYTFGFRNMPEILYMSNYQLVKKGSASYIYNDPIIWKFLYNITK
jgi:hypothetical protein